MKGVLMKFDKVSRALQKSDLDLSVAAQLHQSLVDHVEELTDQFDKFWDDAKLTYIELDAEEYTENLRSSITSDNMGQKKDSCKSSIFTPIMKSLITYLRKRMECYVSLAAKFDFLTKLNKCSANEVSSACKDIASFYVNDVNGDELFSGCELAKHHFFREEKPRVSHQSMLLRITEDELQPIFPNIEIVLRIYLSMFSTNVPDERSFSKLKFIKTSLRNKLSETKLNAFAMMSIEKEVLESLDLEEFVLSKCRKVNM